MTQVNEDLSQLLGRLAAGIDDVIEAEMSTALEVVGEQGSTAAGNLAEIGLPVLMGRIFSDGTTGRLRIWYESVEKVVYFEAGLPVMAVPDLDAAIAAANTSRYGLGASVWTKNIHTARRVFDEVQAGIIWVNRHLTVPPEVPFGGMRESGIGRENGYHAVDQYSRIKTLFLGW